MSRSRKKHPFSGFTTAKSEKQDKILAHKKLRRATKLTLKRIIEVDEDIILPTIKEVSNVYCFAKDGKQYYNSNDDYYKKAIRK